ncbi:glycosyltransferase [Hymenobacter wooponensis]|uniref:Glycosyltransferase n=1 Tax=Hymenobacter wooponensis TaxID=1525360 RepID=A0A4Z0MV33_9BACT|nr:glycosyltransferase [Hymenobacter wooponensis]TGD82995.1 glycosyltransferase [Hymenobacter wooponensis]
MPKVSIIIPTYNRAAFLKEAVESILSQDFQDFNIVITDNASSDNTKETVLGFKSDKIIYHRNDENLGVVNNHNKALELADGEYIAIFSDDDLMFKGSLAKRVAVLDNNKSVVLVHSNIKIIDENNKIVDESHWGKSYSKNWDKFHKKDTLIKGDVYFKILYYEWNVISMPAVMLRSSVIKKSGVFDINTKYFCDWDMWLRVCLYGDVYYLNDFLVNYRVHNTNTIKEINTEISKNELALIKKSLFEKNAIRLEKMGVNKGEINSTIDKQIATYPIAYVDNSIISRVRRKLGSIYRRILH